MLLQSRDTILTVHAVDESCIIELFNAMLGKALQVCVAQGSTFPQILDRVMIIFLPGPCVF